MTKLELPPRAKFRVLKSQMHDVESRVYMSVVCGLEPDDCWIGIRGRKPTGYCTLNIGGKEYGIHRISYALFKGEIPTGLEVCHTCDNPACCNPRHLFLASHKENLLDASRKGRMWCGSNHKNSKLQEPLVRMIRKCADAGVPRSTLAQCTGVTSSAIAAIVNRVNWKHV